VQIESIMSAALTSGRDCAAQSFMMRVVIAGSLGRRLVGRNEHSYLRLDFMSFYLLSCRCFPSRPPSIPVLLAACPAASGQPAVTCNMGVFPAALNYSRRDSVNAGAVGWVL
jgi:hypothetical protein